MLSTVLYYELAMKVPIPVGITVYLLTWGLGHLRCLVISQNNPLSGYKRNYSDNALGITVHKRRRLNISSGCFIDVGLSRLYTLTARTRGEHIPHKHKERNK